MDLDAPANSGKIPIQKFTLPDVDNKDYTDGSEGDNWLKKSGRVALAIGQHVGGQMAIPPTIRPKSLEHDPSEMAYLGTGNQLSDLAPWMIDRANDFTTYRMDRLIPKAVGGEFVRAKTGQLLADATTYGAQKGLLPSMAKGILDSRMLPTLTGKMGTTANIGAGLGVGVGLPMLASWAAEGIREGGNPNKQYQMAMEAGNLEEAGRIAEEINLRNRGALATETIANGVATGSAIGPKGMIAGGAAAAAVVELQNMFPETTFAQGDQDAVKRAMEWKKSPQGKSMVFRDDFAKKYATTGKFDPADFEAFEDQYSYYLSQIDDDSDDFQSEYLERIKALARSGDKEALASIRRIGALGKNYRAQNTK
jgi:hypothetical protein